MEMLNKLFIKIKYFLYYKKNMTPDQQEMLYAILAGLAAKFALMAGVPKMKANLSSSYAVLFAWSFYVLLPFFVDNGFKYQTLADVPPEEDASKVITENQYDMMVFVERTLMGMLFIVAIWSAWCVMTRK